MSRIPRVCEHCNNTFTKDLKPSAIAKGHGRFCCIKCANAAKFGNPENRFWKNVDKSGNCWLWTASVDKDGYGKFYVNHKHIRAHIYSYILHYGEVPKGAFVCHECDNPTCVRPSHIWIGDAKSNNQDAARKGHHSHCTPAQYAAKKRGVDNPNSKFTNDQILAIRALYATGGISQQRIANRFNVCQTCISTIVRRAGWKHV